MNTDNKQLPIKREDYESMLQHAVAVIEHARLEIAKHINGNIASAYWEIGKMLHERKVESGHGDGVVRQLSVDLKERYPKMGLSPRNLWYMKRFYLRYCGSDVKVNAPLHFCRGRIMYIYLERIWMILLHYIMHKKLSKKAGTATYYSMLSN